MSDISVIVPSSTIPSHPSTHIIAETLNSIKYQLPDSPIYVMQDGLRAEQADRAEIYREYIQNLKALEFPNVEVIDFETFHHQQKMTLRVLNDWVKTPLLVFAEHDTPMVDRWIDWPLLQEAVLSGSTNMIRLHYDESIHADHQYMMRGKLTDNLVKTIQWHQRPHLALVEWYKKILIENFSAQARTFIEDKMHSPVSYSAWEDFKLTIYDPCGTGQNMKRSRDIDGRQDDPKYDKDLIW
jgi:hypothetical protein